METFLVAEIDNVIDTEDDLFWQFYKCATCAQRQHQIIIAFNGLRHEPLAKLQIVI